MLAAEQSVTPISTGFHFGVVCTGGRLCLLRGSQGRASGHLASFRDTLQVDGYAGFSSLVEARKDAWIRPAFCWAHARRPFYEFFTSTQSPLAAEVLARVANGSD
jgi:hypothetical protein